MRLAVGEDAGEGCEINTIRLEIEGLDAGNGLPEIGINTTGVDPGIDGSDACRFAVDCALGLAKGGVAAVLKLAGDVRRHAGVPEFIGGLRLRDDVEVDTLEILREGEGADRLVGRGAYTEGVV